MAKRSVHKTELIPHQQVHQRLMQDPAYARVWQETELADQVATLLIAYRAKHKLSQTELARRLGMRQPAIAGLRPASTHLRFGLWPGSRRCLRWSSTCASPQTASN
jgi:ribosome-binding protein aMBF1 (putative translation factor)